MDCISAEQSARLGETKIIETYSYDEAFISSVNYFNGDELAAKVFVDKYALRNENDELLEKTPSDMHWRIAREMARVEKTKFKKPLTEIEIFNYLDKFRRIVMQGSPMYGIGNYYQYISVGNCFVLPSVRDSYLGIMHTDTQITQISCRRGGVGWDNSKLRPKTLRVKNAARTTSGMVGFAKRFSNTIREVGQHGRRGASLQSLSCYHPEILDFITVKQDLTQMTGSNISIQFTDDFMNKVVNNEDVTLRWPVCQEDADEMGKQYPEIENKVKAKTIWDEFIKSAHKMAEPGCMFVDTVHRESPGYPYGQKEVSSNPCVTGDTWVMTKDGPMKVYDLVDRGSFVASVQGGTYSSDVRGFFYTGDRQTIILQTKHGYKIECTPEHKLLVAKLNNGKKTLQWKMAKEIKEGDLLNLEDHSDISWKGHGIFEEGYILGSLVGDGWITEENGAYLSWWGKDREVMKKFSMDMLQKAVKCRSDLGSGSNESNISIERSQTNISSSGLKILAAEFGISKEKTISESIEKSSYDFYRGFLMGWFDTDGTLNYNKSKQRCDVRLCSSNLDSLFIAQRMLARMGIICKIYQNRKEEGNRLLPDGKGGLKEYSCKSTHELIITKNNIKKFADKIGFADPDKSERLKKLISSYVKKGFYNEKYVSSVCIIKHGSIKDVYDCHINNAHCFDANGITVHNCGEQWLPPYASCRLLLLNILSYVVNPFTDKAYFDYNKLSQDAMVLQRLGDNLVDIEVECIDRILQKIKSDPEPNNIKQPAIELWENIRRVALLDRRTGCGLTALGDTIAALGMKYGSDKSIEFADKMQKTFALACYRSSVEMAKEIGPFPDYDSEKDIKSQFIQRIEKEDPVLYADMKKYGRRNMVLLTIAPTGSVSCETQTTSGLEPVFLLSYTRRKKGNPGDAGFRTDFVDANNDCWMHFDVYHKGLQDWMNISGKTNIQESPYYQSTANDIDWIARVKLQASLQKWVDNAISSTINLPKDVSIETVNDIYMMAWKLGCKGVTIYRDGCRNGVLVSSDKANQSNILKTTAPKRPKSLDCDIYHTKSRGEDFFVLVGTLDGHPYEVFAGKNGCITHAKKGKITKAKRGEYLLEAEDGSTIPNVCELLTDEQAVITRMISLSLRHGSDISFVVDQLEKSPGDMTNFGKALSRILKKYIPEGHVVSGANCSSCNGPNIVRSEGCVTCRDCGYSKCS